MRTPEKILEELREIMPYELKENFDPYIKECMEIYAKEYHQDKVNNGLLNSVSDGFTANAVERAYYDGLSDSCDLFNINNYR